MNNDKRFHGVLGSEYELFKLAVPHYDELEETIAQEIKNHFQGSNLTTVKVLEIGSGTGITTRVLLDADPRIHVFALDNEELMMEQLGKNVRVWNADGRVVLNLSDALEYLMGCEENSFDAVASGYVLHNFESKFRDRVITEIHRVLKPRGIFVNGDKYACDDENEQKKAFDEQIKKFEVFDSIGKSEYKEEWIHHYLEDERPEVVFKEEKAKQYMEKLGFKNTHTVYRKGMEAVVEGIK